jgi:hypothetical protein
LGGICLKNKDHIEKVVNKLGLSIGCYDKLVDSLTVKELNKVLENIEYQTDTEVKINRKKHVVEIDIVEKEVDFNLLTKEEYIDRYGV